MSIIIGAGSPRDIASIELATRRGSYIPNERRREGSPASRRAAVEMVVANHDSARCRSATQVYNCMGLAFASRRTWVDTDYLEMILIEDEYRRLQRLEEAQPGDIVVYRRSSDGDVTHVAVIIEIRTDILSNRQEVMVISQWGANGEYTHALDDVNPALGEPTEYWTDRRPVP